MDLSGIINQINADMIKETDKVKVDIQYIENGKDIFNNEEAIKKIEEGRKLIIAAKVENNDKKNNTVNDDKVYSRSSFTRSLSTLFQ
jgi:predicted site-specific integrase-resolvase